MYEFKSPEMQDKPWVDKLLNRPENLNCELCFGNLFIWSSVYNNLIVNFNNLFIAKNINERSNVYSFPIGDADDAMLKKAIEFLIEDAKADGKICTFYGMTSKQQTQLEELMPGVFSYSANRDYFDYLYTRESLAGLSGKKLHSKRNHIGNFKRMYPDWSYEPITISNLTECLDMHFRWIEENDTDTENSSYQNELKAVKLAFNHFEDLAFSGGLIRIDDKVVAYTFGEAINDHVFCTHVEKAFSEIRGAYPIINQEFALHQLADYELVNREEDLGLPGLRKAKLSYHPHILLEKRTGVYEGAL